MQLNSRFHVVIPASGIGTRFGSSIPKQYNFMANGNTVLDNVIKIFIDNGHFDTIVVVLQNNDTFFQHSIFYNHPQITTVIGGEQRFLSVKNALTYLEKHTNNNDFICVHDGVRPCVIQRDINNLLTAIDDDDIGGLLVSPVVDTLKIKAEGKIVNTVSRDNIYNALTPQIYRLKVLQQALYYVISNNIVITDDASSIEEFGKQSIAVVGSKTNIKITTKQDLRLANLIQKL